VPQQLGPVRRQLQPDELSVSSRQPLDAGLPRPPGVDLAHPPRPRRRGGRRSRARPTTQAGRWGATARMDSAPATAERTRAARIASLRLTTGEGFKLAT